MAPPSSASPTTALTVASIVTIGAVLLSGCVAERAVSPERDELTDATDATEATETAEVAAAGTTSPDERWAAAAVERFDAELEAAGVGISDYLRYFADSVVVAGWSGLDPIEGRSHLQDLLLVSYGSTFDELHHHLGFVDRTGALLQLRLDRRTGFTGPVEVVELRRYAPGGVAAVHTLVSSEQLRRHPAARGRVGFAPIEALVRTHRALWSGAEGLTVEHLYTPDARVIDTVTGLSLRGASGVAAYLAASRADGTRRLRPTPIPGTSSPAVYLDHRDPAAADHLALVIEVDEGGGCPGRVALFLTLAEGRIAQERRFHDVADARRCGTELPGGWWDHLREPPRLDEVTARLRVDGQTVTIRGSTPALDGLVRWALERFALAGLPSPQVASVTFATATGRCEGVSGTITPTPDAAGSDVLLCLSEQQACVGDACERYTFAGRVTALHEFGHVWDASWLTPRTRRHYLEETGLTAWFDGGLAWSERGGERAAEVLMWGLLDREVPLVRLDRPSCEQLQHEFRLLTGVDPVSTTCADPSVTATG
jgi:hypothetical protein